MSLIDADRTWFSAHGGRVESVLSDLQVAVESLCYSFIWDPLRSARGGHDLLAFKREDEQLREKRYHPNLASYAWACRQTFFANFLSSAHLEGDDVTFLMEELPAKLDELRNQRNVSEHDPERRWRKDEITRTYRTYLGIGCPGILPRLAEIKRKIDAPGRRRSPR